MTANEKGEELYCDSCKKRVAYCASCGKKFAVGDTVYCFSKHYCLECFQ